MVVLPALYIRQWAGRSGARIPVWLRDIAILQYVQNIPGVQPDISSVRSEAMCYHSPPPSTEVRNEWMYTSAPRVCLYGMESDNFNLLKPTGHVTHRQFNIQQLYALPTVCLCVLCLSENKQRLVPLTA
jgi:hypothetical protein